MTNGDWEACYVEICPLYICVYACHSTYELALYNTVEMIEYVLGA